MATEIEAKLAEILNRYLGELAEIDARFHTEIEILRQYGPVGYVHFEDLPGRELRPDGAGESPPLNNSPSSLTRRFK